MDVRIDVDSAEATARLGRLPGACTEGMYGAMQDATALLLREMQLYPPQRSGSSYRRTGTLKRSWFRNVQRGIGSVTGSVTSSGAIAPYNQQVQREGMQSAVHRGRWQTEVQVVDRMMPHVLRLFEERVGSATQR